MNRGEFFSLLRGSFFIFAFRIMGAILVFVTQVFLARSMGAAQLGIYAFAFSSSIMLALLAGFGYPSACIRFVGHYLSSDDPARIRGFIRRGRQIVLGTGLALAILGTILICFNPSRLVPEEYRYPLMFAVLSAPVFGMLRFHTQLANAFSWNQLAFFPSMTVRPLLFLVVIWMIWFVGGTLTAANTMLVQIIVMAAIFLGQAGLLHRRLGKQSLSAKPIYEARAWRRVAMPLTIVDFFNSYFPEVAIVSIGFYLPAHELGIMNAGFRIALVIAFGIVAIDAVIMPQISRLHAKGETRAIQRLITHTTRVKFCASAAALVVLAIWGKLILGLFGKDFIAGYTTLLIIAGAQSLVAAIGPVGSLLSITGLQDHCVYVYASCMGIMLVLMPVVIPKFGMEGAAAVVLLVMLVWLMWMYALVVRHLGIKSAIVSFGRAPS